MAHTIIVALPETGLVKADLGLLLYDGSGDSVSTAAVTVTETSDRHYTIAALPDGSTADPHTLTLGTPSVVETRRWPTLVSPPDVVVVRLGVTGEAGTLTTTLYRDAVEYEGATLTITEPATGDYKLTGIPDLSGSWKLVIESTLSVVEIDWPGASTGVLVTVADLKDWLGEAWTTSNEDFLEAAEASAVNWMERETQVLRLRTGVVSPVLRGPGGTGALILPCAITATDSSGNPRLTSLEYRGGLGGDWTEIDLDDVEIEANQDHVTHDVYWTGGSWPVGIGVIRPTYLTGYQAEGEPSTPPELAMAIKEVVAQHFFGSRQSTKREAVSFDTRFERLVDPIVRRYTNPYKGATQLLRAVI